MGRNTVQQTPAIAIIAFIRAAATATMPVLATTTGTIPLAWAQAPVLLTVNSQYMSGQLLTAMWTTLSQNGQTVATGFSTAQFSISSGQQYTVAISDYGGIVFDHWLDNSGGNANSSRAVSIGSDTVLTAVYRNTP